MKLTKNRKFSIWKHFYEFSKGDIKIMPICKTNNYSYSTEMEKKLNKFILTLKRATETNTHRG